MSKIVDFLTATHLYTSLQPLLLEPTPIFKGNKVAADCIKAHEITSNILYVEIPLRYLHELHELGILTFKHCLGQVIFADILTKQAKGPKHHEGLQRLVGFHHYPPPSSLHYQLLNSYQNLYTRLR